MCPKNNPPHTKKSQVYLTVCKFTVLHVHFAVQSSDTGVRVVVGVFTNTVWETLLKTVKNVTVKVSWEQSNKLSESAGAICFEAT